MEGDGLANLPSKQRACVRNLEIAPQHIRKKLPENQKHLVFFQVAVLFFFLKNYVNNIIWQKLIELVVEISRQQQQGLSTKEFVDCGGNGNLMKGSFVVSNSFSKAGFIYGKSVIIFLRQRQPKISITSPGAYVKKFVGSPYMYLVAIRFKTMMRAERHCKESLKCKT